MSKVLSHGIKASTSNRDQVFVGLIFLMGLFLPSGLILYSFIPVAITMLSIRFFDIHFVKKTQFFIISLLLFSFVFNSFIGLDLSNDSKSYLRSLVIFELFLFFPFIGNVKISNKALYFALLYIFFSQVSYMWGYQPLIKFFNDFYPYEGEHLNYKADYLLEHANEISLTNRYFRLGGLYHNPNLAASYLNILFAVFIIENFNRTFKSNFPFILMCSCAIVATGSRTGFFIAAAIFVYYIYFRSSDKKKVLRNAFLLTTLFIFFFFLYLFSFDSSLDLRFLDYQEGLEKSLYIKLKIFDDYILDIDLNFMTILFGNFTNGGVNSIQFDSEWGELIYRYGIFFFIILLVFYFQVFNSLTSEKKIIFFILLWMISATVLMNYRTSFLFMLLLSKYYSQSMCLYREYGITSR